MYGKVKSKPLEWNRSRSIWLENAPLQLSESILTAFSKRSMGVTFWSYYPKPVIFPMICTMVDSFCNIPMKCRQIDVSFYYFSYLIVRALLIKLIDNSFLLPIRIKLHLSCNEVGWPTNNPGWISGIEWSPNLNRYTRLGVWCTHQMQNGVYSASLKNTHQNSKHQLKICLAFVDTSSAKPFFSKPLLFASQIYWSDGKTERIAAQIASPLIPLSSLFTRPGLQRRLFVL